MEYYQYSNRFAEIIESLGLNPKHRPHDCRVTFVTLAKKYNVDEYAIKRMVGHAISDITEQVYTHRDLDWFISEIEKIK
jgi:integrase